MKTAKVIFTIAVHRRSNAYDKAVCKAFWELALHNSGQGVVTFLPITLHLAVFQAYLCSSFLSAAVTLNNLGRKKGYLAYTSRSKSIIKESRDRTS